MWKMTRCWRLGLGDKNINTTKIECNYIQSSEHSSFTGYQPYAHHWAYGGPTLSSTSSASWSSCPTTSHWSWSKRRQTDNKKMSQKNQSSSNDTSFSFGANAAPAQAINDTPVSQESGGGGTMSYRAAGSIASTSSFTVVNQADVVRGGSARRSTSARSPRAARSRVRRWPKPVGRGHAGGWGR